MVRLWVGNRSAVSPRLSLEAPAFGRCAPLASEPCGLPALEGVSAGLSCPTVSHKRVRLTTSEDCPYGVEQSVGVTSTEAKYRLWFAIGLGAESRYAGYLATLDANDGCAILSTRSSPDTSLRARYGRGIAPAHSPYLLISYHHLWLEARTTSFVGMSKVFMALDLDVIILSASLAAPAPRP